MKVMVVEDDAALREIYGIRIAAEGYDVVSAGDGEEALAVAVREKPDLILSDVMMPKISGFDMLDILRSTPETQNIKVVPVSNFLKNQLLALHIMGKSANQDHFCASFLRQTANYLDKMYIREILIRKKCNLTGYFVMIS